MNLSIFDIFTIGIGPSSSHTVGPMRASKMFIDSINISDISKIKTLKCDLYGSLAQTGKGHGTDKAIILGLLGHTPEEINSDLVNKYINDLKVSKKLQIGSHQISFDAKVDIKFNRRISLPFHPNGLCLCVYDNNHNEIFKETYFSVGGGFILTESEKEEKSVNQELDVKYKFNNANELLQHCRKSNKSISQISYENELSLRSQDQVDTYLNLIWNKMRSSIKRGLKNEGILPGGLKVKRRAPHLYRDLSESPEKNLKDVLNIIDWVNLYALAVNEENAAGGQVVTAPTNGAAGIIPAVLSYYDKFVPNSSQQGVKEFLLTAGTIGMLYKKNASISGAEVGCQGEVGVACSMAAGALCHVMGGNIEQVENAAEIAMEHNLGLTCDPIGGLVQIPCIERNAMGALKAINASRMSLRGDGSHYVSLDKVIKTMYQTGKDMKKRYKETSKGGLAVNLPEC